MELARSAKLSNFAEYFSDRYQHIHDSHVLNTYRKYQISNMLETARTVLLQVP